MAALFNSSGRKSIIGLDIAPYGIYMLEAKGNTKSPNLLQVKHGNANDIQFTDHGLEDSAQLKQLLQPMLAPTYCDKVALCIDDHYVSQHILQLETNLSDEDIEDNVSFELERRLAFPLEEAYFDFSILQINAEDSSQNDILVTACQRNIIESQLTICNELGLEVVLVSTASNVLGNLLAHLQSQQKSQATDALIYINNDYARIVICSNDKIIFTDAVKTDSDPLQQKVNTLITLAQPENQNLELDTLYLCGKHISEQELSQLEPAHWQNTLLFNPFASWKSEEDKITNPGAYCLAAGLAMEGLRK